MHFPQTEATLTHRRPAIKVTFDTNTLSGVVDPDQHRPVGFACHIPFVTPIVSLFSRYCTPIRTAPINR
jgi:hypothetical protein